MRIVARPFIVAPLVALIALAAVGLPGPHRAAHAQLPGGVFLGTPRFDATGSALAVFAGGTTAELEAAAQAAGASGVWVQDRAGAFQLLVVNGPTFLKTPFIAAFPGGLGAASPVTLVRAAGAGSPAAPVATPTPAPTATPTAPAATPVVSTFEAAVAQEIVPRTNTQRSANGLGALRRNSLLDTSAAAYARVVFERDPYLSNVADAHTLDGQPWDRATRVGYVWAAFAENVATMSVGSQPQAALAAQTIVDGWMNSPPHRANILTGGYVDTGVGCATGRPASPRPGLEFAIVCVAVYGTPK